MRTGLSGGNDSSHMQTCFLSLHRRPRCKTKRGPSFELFQRLIELERESTIITLLPDSLRRHGEDTAMACLAHRIPPPSQFQKGPVFLLFLQLLHGALVREHRGDGCKYLVAGDLLAAGHVPHFGRQERSTAGYTDTAPPSGHQVLTEDHKQRCQVFVFVFLQRFRPVTRKTD